ncbi:MAG TPA: hypothetical protein QGH10_20550 [Armatimonadota bacterium]|nr:hypothetical protein [Armatimonadota bacterium]
MADEQILEPASKPKPWWRIPLVLVVLASIAVAVNWNDDQSLQFKKLLTGEKSPAEVLAGKTMRGSGENGGGSPFQFPEPLGPEDAKVKLTVWATEGDPCQHELVGLMAGVSTVDDGKLRIEFVSGETSLADGEPLSQLCGQGLAINGETKIEVPVDAEKPKVYYFTGTPDGSHGWKPDDLALALNSEIDKAYGAPGVFTGEQLMAAASDGAALVAVPGGVEGAGATGGTGPGMMGKMGKMGVGKAGAPGPPEGSDDQPADPAEADEADEDTPAA